MNIQRITFNLSPANVRVEKLEGRDHYVVPAVMMTEGVHAGSNGPLYYPPEELGKDVHLWNHKPVVVYHPEKSGTPISACEPDVLNTQKVGILLNTRFDKKLRTEVWIDKERALSVDDRVVNAIEARQPMEVSTGLFTDNEQKPGTWNGEEYTAIARNHRPDHLALLPDQQGACSLKDGAGLLVNASIKSNYLKSHLAALIANERSFDAIRNELGALIQAKYGEDFYVMDVFDTHLIFGTWKSTEMQKIDYTSEGEDKPLKLSGVPTRVVREVVYRDLAITKNNGGEPPMASKERVTKLITANVGYTEADRASLEATPDALFEKIEKSATPVEPAKPVETPPVVPANNTAKPATMAEFIANAPPEMQGALSSMLSSHVEARGEAIKIIKNAKGNTFTDAQLDAMDLSQLKAMGNLISNAQPAPAPVPAQPGFWGGAAGAAPVTPPAPTANSDKPAVEEPLVAPTLNFEDRKWGAAAKTA